MDIIDSSNIFTELQLQQSEDDNEQVYYTILHDDELLDPLSLVKDVEIDGSENQSIIKLDDSLNMALLEQITLPDGTQAYMKRDMCTDDDLLEQNPETFEYSDSVMLLQDIGETLTCELNVRSEDEDDAAVIPEEDLANNVILSTDDVEYDETKYEQVQLEDGTVAMIEKSLYNSILEQSKKKEQSAKSTKEVSEENTKIYECPNSDCDKSYSSMHHLRVHMRIHTGSRPYKCKVEGCDKAFATGYSLKAHSRTHTGEKPYGCHTCVKSFKTSGDLQKHIRIHTGEKPFTCPIEGCGRSFTTSNIRKVHIRSHTGERPYQCPEPGCLKAFASATNYKNHIRIHSGEKPYACTVEGCGKRFTEYSSLYKHQIVHTNAKSCKCEYCGHICRTQTSLMSHKRSVHNIIITDDGTEIMIKMVDNSSDSYLPDDANADEKINELGAQILFISE